MRYAILCGLALFLAGAGCESAGSSAADAPPLWFRAADFDRPGDPAGWNTSDPPVSFCGQVLAGLATCFSEDRWQSGQDLRR